MTGDDDTGPPAPPAPDPIGGVPDLLPPSAGTAPVRTAAMTVREYGRVVLMGGVGMLGGDDLALPSPWLMRNSISLRGQWLAPRTANASLIALARAGLLELDQFAVTEFGLDDITGALDHAAGLTTRFALAVVRP